MQITKSVVPAAVLALAIGMASTVPARAQEGSATSDAVMKKLDKKEFKNVHADVDANGIATLTGTVDLYEYKMEADRRAHKAKGVKGVRDDIQVEGPTVSDAELQKKLQEKLAYDRVGYYNVFNAIAVSVQNGVVTLSGHARTYPDQESALALVSTQPGVKDVENDIQVDPTSLMDDQTRLAVARAVYGDPMLNKYAIDPAKPIRISVQNGHVELSGVVDSKVDKETAYMRANGVSGVFSVKNDLQVAGQAGSKESANKNQ